MFKLFSFTNPSHALISSNPDWNEITPLLLNTSQTRLWYDFFKGLFFLQTLLLFLPPVGDSRLTVSGWWYKACTDMKTINPGAMTHRQPADNPTYPHTCAVVNKLHCTQRKCFIKGTKSIRNIYDAEFRGHWKRSLEAHHNVEAGSPPPLPPCRPTCCHRSWFGLQLSFVCVHYYWVWFFNWHKAVDKEGSMWVNMCEVRP